MKFTILDVVSERCESGVENMYEMTLVLDDAPTRRSSVDVYRVEILCGEESVMVREDDGKRKRISYQGEGGNSKFDAQCHHARKGDGRNNIQQRSLARTSYDGRGDAAGLRKNAAQAVLRDLAEAKAIKARKRQQ